MSEIGEMSEVNEINELGKMSEIGGLGEMSEVEKMSEIECGRPTLSLMLHLDQRRDCAVEVAVQDSSCWW